MDGTNQDIDLSTLATQAKTLLKASNIDQSIDSNTAEKVEPIPQSQDTKAGQKLEESTSKLDKIKAKFKERFNLWAEHVLGLSGLSYKESHQMLDEETSKIKELENGKDLKDVYEHDGDGNLIKSDLMIRYEHMHNGKKAVGMFGLTRGYEKFALQKRQELRSFATVAYANSEVDFIKAFIDKVAFNIAGLEVIGDSMKDIPEMQPGAKVPMKFLPIGTNYKRGDIIVFYRDGHRIVHQVKGVKVISGKKYYITQGVNKETNPNFDSKRVCEDHVLGKVDLSKNAYLKLNKLAENGRISFIDAYAMPEVNPLSQIQENFRFSIENILGEVINQKIGNTYDIVYEIYERTNNFFNLFQEVIDGRFKKSVLGAYRDLMIAVNAINEINGLNDKELEFIKQAFFDICSTQIIKHKYTLRNIRDLNLPKDLEKAIEPFWKHYNYHPLEKIYEQNLIDQIPSYDRFAEKGKYEQMDILWQLSNGMDFKTGKKFIDLYKDYDPDGLGIKKIEEMERKEPEKLKRNIMDHLTRHHYRTDLDPNNNKLDCRVSALVLLWEDIEDDIHNDIDNDPAPRYQGIDAQYAKRFKNTIKSLLEGKAPSYWFPQYRKEFNSFTRRTVDKNVLGIKFLFYEHLM